MKCILLILLAIWAASMAPSQAQSLYTFGNGNIPLSTTQNYLKRSGMVSLPEIYDCSPSQASLAERTAFESFLQTAHPKMLMGTGLWSESQYLIRDINDCHFSRCALASSNIHSIDSDVILGASLDEVVCQSVRDGAWEISVPANLLATYNNCVASIQSNHPEYGCTPLAFSVPTYFDYRGIAADTPVPLGQYGYEVDITKPLAQLWYFYLAKRYIDSGFEMLRLGQLQLTAAHESNTGYPKTFQLTRVIREYAKLHARRGVILFDVQFASPYFTLPSPNIGRLPIFDICGLPTRLHSRNAVPAGTGLDPNGTPTASTAQDYEVLLSQRANGKPDWATIGGGQAEYWGNVAHLPVYVEFDNVGEEAMWATNNPTGHAPAENQDGNPNGGFPWGWDECTWFYKQSLVFESQWLVALYNRVQCLTDYNGTFCMPLKRPYTYYNANGQRQDGNFDVYNPANPDFKDLSQSIKSIWDQNIPGVTIKDAFNSWPNALPASQLLQFYPSDPTLVTLANLNSDDREDALYRNPYTNALEIYLGSGADQFTYSGTVTGLSVNVSGDKPSFNSRLTVGDFNNDGLDDFLVTANKAVGEYYTTYQVYLNNATSAPSFTAGPLSYNGPSWGERIYVGDFNGDGFDDLLATADRKLLSNAWGGYRTYLNKGAGYAVPEFTAPISNSADGFPSWGERFFIGDYNGDGSADFLVTGDKDTNPDYVWKGYKIYLSQLHVGQAQPQALFTLSSSNNRDNSFPSWGENIYPFDVNGDRHTDLLVTAATQFGINWDGYKVYAANNEGTHLLFATESTDNSVFGKNNTYAKVDRPHRAWQTITSYYAPTQSLVYNTLDYSCDPVNFANRMSSAPNAAPAIARPIPSSTNIEVLPNPSSRYFDIHVPAATVTHYVLLDLSGRVLQTATTSGTDRFSLDGATLPPGLYVIQLTTSEGPMQAKLVKSN